MSAWQERFASKVSTAEAAVQLIAPGRRILIGSGAAEPARLVEALVSAAARFADNPIVHLMTLGPAPYVRPEYASAFRHTAFFIGENTRAAIRDGRADYLPVFLSEIPSLIRGGRIRVDVALIQVSPPDAHGMVSLGVSVDVVRAAVDTAELILAEVNPRMPRTLGDSFLPVSRIDRLVPVDAPLLERTPEPLDEVALEIGRNVARLVPDGATVQTGIGKIPDAVLAALAKHRDLGVHTEMLSDGVMQLAEAGVITGRKKSLLPSKMVTSFVMGTRALYEWVHDHPGVELRPTEFTNDPQVIARNDHMVAINAALAVDLTGQVAADSLGTRFYSGIGGQVDFIRGASRSLGGRAIIALRSTAELRGKDGGAPRTVSRIQPTLEAGAGVVTSRGDVRYVVTEHGIADLWGRSVRERAMALISVAHPDFRGELLAAAKERHYVFPDQRAPRGGPWKEARAARLADGAELILRPVTLTDETALQELFYRLSDESTLKRFLCPGREHPHEQMQRLCDPDEDSSMGLVACAPDSGAIVAMTRYDVDPATRLADIAFVVRDEYRSRGLGTALMRRMIEIARGRGVTGFRARVPVENKAMRAVFQLSGLRFSGAREDGSWHLTARFDDPATALPATGAQPDGDDISMPIR